MDKNIETNNIIDAEYEEIPASEVKIEGINEEDVQKFRPIMQHFLSSYATKTAETTVVDWLSDELKANLPNKTDEEIAILSRGLIAGVELFHNNITSLNDACAEGQTKEGWFREKLQNEAKEKNIAIQEYGNYLSLLNQVVTDSNQAMLDAVQSKGGIIKLDAVQSTTEDKSANVEWNAYNTAAIALNIGKHASLAGIGSAALSTGFNLGLRAAKGEKIKGEDVIRAALLSSKDGELKSAAAGALQVGIDRGLVPLLPKNLSPNAISNIACMGIENARIFAMLADGKINSVQALEYLARGSVATVSGLSCEGIGATIGATLFSFVPVVGTTVGGIVGGLVGRMAGSKIGQAIHKGIEKIKPVAVSVAKKTWNVVTSTVKAVGGMVRSLGRKIASFFGF